MAIEVPGINIKSARVRLVGDSSLIVHAWSEKAKEEMRAKQQKRARAAREAKDPFADFVGALYWLSPKPKAPTQADIESATFAFPAVAFKAAAVRAAKSVGMAMTDARTAFHIDAELVPIIGPPPVMREDMVRIQQTTDIRYRPEFKTWAVELDIRFNSGMISEEQIVNLFNIAGFGVGVGEWRPERDGSNGRFHVD